MVISEPSRVGAHAAYGRRASFAPVPRGIIGIGASAGGIEALSRLLANGADCDDLGFVLVLHQSSDFSDFLPKVLGASSALRVVTGVHGQKIASGSVVVCPAGVLPFVYRGHLILKRQSRENTLTYMPIDNLFLSLARDQGARSVGIILSGTGTDGLLGCQGMRKLGGFVITQDVHEAAFSGMPEAIIREGGSCVTLPAAEILGRVRQLHFAEQMQAGLASELTPSPEEQVRLNTIFLAIRNEKGVDLESFRHSIVQETLERTKAKAGLDSLSYLLCELEKDADLRSEFVGDLFHSRPTCSEIMELAQSLTVYAVPNILSEAQAKKGKVEKLESPALDKVGVGTLRVWNIGCTNGEESVVFFCALDAALSALAPGWDVRVFSTDVQREHVVKSVQREYSSEALANLPEEWTDKYFTQQGKKRILRPEYRDKLCYSVHHVLDDPPLPNIDIVVCLQHFILLCETARETLWQKIQYALGSQGYLLLSGLDLPVQRSGLSPVEGAPFLFRSRSAVRTNKSEPVDRSDLLEARLKTRILPKTHEADARVDETSMYLDILMRTSGPLLVFDEDFGLLCSFGNCKPFLLNRSGPVNNSLSSLLPQCIADYLVGLKKQLESGDESLIRGSMDIQWKEQEETWQSAGSRQLDIILHKFSYSETGMSRNCKVGYICQFTASNIFPSESDGTSSSARSGGSVLDPQHLNCVDELKRRNAFLEYKMNAKNIEIADLRAAMRESLGELQKRGEELQSANVELQAVNEELFTVNRECQLRIKELTESNFELTAFHEFSGMGCLYLDTSLRIRKFNTAAGRLCGLSATDVGRSFSQISGRFKKELKKIVQAAFEQQKSFEERWQPEDGREFILRVGPFEGPKHRVEGVVLLMIDISEYLHGHLTSVANTSQLVQMVSHASPLPLVLLDIEGRILHANLAYLQAQRTRSSCCVGRRHQDFLKKSAAAQFRAKLIELQVSQRTEKKPLKISYTAPLGRSDKRMVEWSLCFANAGRRSSPADRCLILSVLSLSVESEDE